MCTAYAGSRETPQNHSAKLVHINLGNAEILQNSHLINFVEVACRHQWVDGDISLQRTVHKLHAVSQSFWLTQSPFLSPHKSCSMPILGLFNHYVIFLFLFYQKQIYTESLAIWYISHYPTCLAFLSLVSSILHCLSTPITSLYWDHRGPQLLLKSLPHTVCSVFNFSVIWSLHSSSWKAICWPWTCLKYSFNVFCFPKINSMFDL